MLFLRDEVKIIEKKVIMVSLKDRMAKREDQVWTYNLRLCIVQITKFYIK